MACVIPPFELCYFIVMELKIQVINTRIRLIITYLNTISSVGIKCSLYDRIIRTQQQTYTFIGLTFNPISKNICP